MPQMQLLFAAPQRLNPPHTELQMAPVQAPCVHLFPDGHTLPQPPQLSGSFSKSVHEPSHSSANGVPHSAGVAEGLEEPEVGLETEVVFV